MGVSPASLRPTAAELTTLDAVSHHVRPDRTDPLRRALELLAHEADRTGLRRGSAPPAGVHPVAVISGNALHHESRAAC